MACPLCTLDRRTAWYMETPHWVILQCDTCGVPMAVWREHTEEIPELEKQAMLVALAQVADRELGEGQWWFDSIRRMIPEHPHWHARGSWW
jgi:isoleucyl-tRNA synthetase